LYTKGDVGVDREVSTKKQQHHLSTTAAQHYQSPIPPRSSTKLQPVPSDSDSDEDEGGEEETHGDHLLCVAFRSLAVNNSRGNNNALVSTKVVNVENVPVTKFKSPLNHPLHTNKKPSFSHFTFDLMVGLDKLDDAVSLHNACCKEGSMMRYVLNKVVGYKLLSEQNVYSPL